MLTFVFRKMLNKKWMILSLLIGNILLVSITCCNPIYTKAILQRTLTRNLNDYLLARNRYPGTVTMNGSFSMRNKQLSGLEHFQWVDAQSEQVSALFGLPAVETVRHFYLSSQRADRLVKRGGDDGKKSFEIGFLSNMDEHVELIAGRMYSHEPDERGFYDVIVSMSMLIKNDLLLDEEYVLPQFEETLGEPLRIRIAGVFSAKSDDVYWVRQPSAYNAQFFMPEELFRRLFYNADDPKFLLSANWYTLLDYEAMRGDSVEQMLATNAKLSAEVSEVSGFRYYDDFSSTMQAYQIKARKVQITLWVLQAPVFVLLGAFIFMVSLQMLQLEQNEIAILKSRGSGKRQIISVYVIQSVVLSLAALAVGIPLGAFLCQVLGSSNAFLEFVRRKSLSVELDRTVWLFAGAASLFSLLVMVLPVIRFSDVTIVGHKQKKARKGGAWWQKAFLDVVLLGVSLYGLYTYGNQKELLAARVADGASLDPLLFMSSSLFIIGAGLLALRVIPWLVWLIYTLGKKMWSPALYASFLRVLRARDNQGFIMVFLILTIALGIFNAQTARTINTNEEDRIRYNNGADLVLMEQWSDNAESAEDASKIEYYEPDFGKYSQMEGAESLTRVLNVKDVIVTVPGGSVRDVQLQGISTKEYGETAWFKEGLLDRHWYNYLNAISQNASAVLVSKNFEDKYGLKIGDVVTYKRKSGGSSVRGVIYGFVEYWPGYNAIVKQRGTDGLTTEVDNFLVVSHLSQLQATWGMQPYQIWVKAKDSTQFAYDFAEQRGLRFVTFKDASREIVEMKNDPVFQGTNGILTVSFIVVLMLCATGFLIYWVLSIHSRALQFGIFRAMGMSIREILTMLVNEQMFISGLSIVAGAVVGVLASRLFIPLIQITYGASEQSLPLRIISESSDNFRLFAVIGAMLLICMLILGALISRIKITQALKLGED